MNDYVKKYVERRKKMRKWAWIALIFALVNALPFPIPIPGVFAYYVSLVLFIFSVITLIIFYQPPSIKIVGLVSGKTNGYITASILIHFLDISALTAENLISRLFLGGYLRIENKITDETPIAQWVCTFVGIFSSYPSHSLGEHVSVGDEERPRPAPLTPDVNLSEYTRDNPEITVSDINNMILQNSMHVGSSGQPVV